MKDKKRFIDLNKKRGIEQGRFRIPKTVLVFAALVVFLTTYALILPAISLDRAAVKKMSGVRMESGSGQTGGIASAGDNQDEGGDGQPDSVPAINDDSSVQNPDQDIDLDGEDESRQDGEGLPGQEDQENPKEDTESTDDSHDEDSQGNTDNPDNTVEPDDGDKNDQSGSENNTGEESTDIENQDQEVKGSYLKGTFTVRDESFEVSVTVKEDARLPEDAEFYVKRIKKVKKYMNMARKDLGITDFSKASFFDMGFALAGKKVEPAKPVQVTMRLKEEIDGQLIHFTDTGAELIKTNKPFTISDTETGVPMSPWDQIETDEEVRSSFFKTVWDFLSYVFHNGLVPSGDSNSKESEDSYKTTVRFRTDGFSVFAIVERSYKENYLSCSGEDYVVTVKCPAGARVSEDAKLYVDEIDADSDDYNHYIRQAEDMLAPDQDNPVSYARIFSIRIAEDGNTIQPAVPVEVQVNLDDSLGKDVHTLHFKGKRKAEVISDQVNSKKGSVRFRTDRSSVYGIVDTTIEKKVLTSDGNTYKVTLTFDSRAGIPANAQLNVEEIKDKSKDYERYVRESETALGWQKGSIPYARLFDISILDGDDPSVSYQPKTPVKVDIVLEDKESQAGMNVVHFGKKTEVLDNTGQNEAVSFETSSFSVYAIVDLPDPDMDFGVVKVDSLEEIARMGEKGLYMRHPDGYYFTNKTYNASTTRTGIRKTKPAAANPQEADGCVKYYFEKVEGKNNQFLVSCTDEEGSGRQYINQSSNSLSFSSREDATAFTISAFPNNPATFRMAGTGGYYWNMQSGAGGNGFAAYNASNDVNARIQLEYMEEDQTDPFELDGKSCGIAWYDAAITGTGLTDEAKSGLKKARLSGKDLIVRPDVLDRDGYLLVAKDASITEWTFHYISEGQYYVTTNTDQGLRYLTIKKDEVLLLEEPNEIYSRIRISRADEDGRYYFRAGGYFLNLVNGQTKDGFDGRKDASNTCAMCLVEKSESLTDEDIVICTAHKIGASNTAQLKNGSQVIVYTRIWNNDAKRYEFYAVDHDGSLIRCYESGDVIQWVSSKINTALWDFTEYFEKDGVTPNFYYELYNAYSKKYIAPQLKGGQILSDKKLGINLNGRRYGDDYTSIIAWDDPYYEYAGLRAENGKLVTCPLAEASDFYFAVMEKVTPEQLTTVDTIDNDQYGIRMKMVDFNSRISNNRDTLQTSVLGKDKDTTGLVSTNLTDGYPMTDATVTGTGKSQSLSVLFDEKKMQEANHLFIDSTYHESGYFTYDSTQNFARLGSDGNFTVYDQLGAIGNETRPTRTHGQFMPYNDLTPGLYSSVTNQTDVLAQPLSDLDPRKGEKLHMIRTEEADYFFGMEMEAAFTQTASGLDAWGHDIIFEFSGDDDFWLYVDGELVLDLGGVHSAQVGSINFRTGEVSRSLHSGETGTGKFTLRQLFESNYRTRNPKASDQEVTAWLNGIFTKNDQGQYVFKDYTKHTMKMFYMERGSGASNLKMRFNLAAVKPGTVVLNKTISGTDKQDYKLAEFPYQIFYRTEDNPDYRLLEEMDGEGYHVTYTGKNTPVKYAKSFTPASGRQPYDHVFFLKPGQSAAIRLPDKTTDYYIRECGINPVIYDQVKANNEILQGKDDDGDGRSDFTIKPASIEDRPQVDYDNHVNPDALRTLTITKKLFAEDGKTLLSAKDDPAEFQFRLYLGGENDQDLPPAYMYDYYVKDERGNYCRWDPQTESFVSLGKTDLALLSQDEKKAAVFTTSPNGGISRIPAGYSVEIRDLLVDTRFKVEERENEIPKGYSLKGYQRVEGSYIGESNSGTIRDNSDPAIEVHNQRGWGLSLEKVWSDADYMESHDPVYFGVYVPGEKGEPVLLDGSLRQLTTDQTSLYWYFDTLEKDLTFDRYNVYEVALTNPKTDDEGKVTSWDQIRMLDEGDQITIGGTAKGKDHVADGYTYSISCSRGQLTGSSDKVKNVRTDQITNSRTGVLIKKVDGEGQPLAGAKFTLKDSKGNDLGAPSYVSDKEGMVTLACLEKGETYILTETETPKGYQSMLEEDKVKICLEDDGSVTVNGAADSGNAYTITQGDGAAMPEIAIINKPFIFEARKIDAESRLPMADVRFRLFSQVFDLDGQPVRDYLPIMGFDRLVTDEKGLIPRIDGSLEPGVYYLSETAAPEGYEAMAEDICFSISRTGKVTLNNVDLLTWMDKKEKDGKICYTLMVSNMRKRTVQIIKRGSDNGPLLAEASFSLYSEDKVEGEKPKAGIKPDITGTTEEAGTIDLGTLAPGIYYLFEDKAPDGYIGLDAPVIIKVEPGRFTAYYLDSPLEVNDLQPGLRQVTVWNHSGYELPSSGGIGTWLYRFLGGMILATALVLYFRRRTLN